MCHDMLYGGCNLAQAIGAVYHRVVSSSCMSNSRIFDTRWPSPGFG